MNLPGLNIQAPWARFLLNRKKTIETRTYTLPGKYLSEDLWLIETPGQLGTFKARVIGIIRFSKSKQYGTAAEFDADYDSHLVPRNEPTYRWREGVPKHGWIVESVRPIAEFDAPSPRGIVFARPFKQRPRLDQ